MFPVFDQAHFDHMTAGDRALQAEVAALFRAQADALRTACAGEDWRTTVHTLKGSARGIGLMALAHACEEAEAAGDEAARERVTAALCEALSALVTA